MKELLESQSEEVEDSDRLLGYYVCCLGVSDKICILMSCTSVDVY